MLPAQQFHFSSCHRVKCRPISTPVIATIVAYNKEKIFTVRTKLGNFIFNPLCDVVSSEDKVLILNVCDQDLKVTLVLTKLPYFVAYTRVVILMFNGDLKVIFSPKLINTLTTKNWIFWLGHFKSKIVSHSTQKRGHLLGIFRSGTLLI